uniref:Uncharacterized protein n=1 Tax=Pseudomonas aeruginosa TaxID=287 RepID=Q9APT5_PSEAI|nr:hypothetical protein [Pseudomonas aeruginosa]
MVPKPRRRTFLPASMPCDEYIMLTPSVEIRRQ